MTATDSLRTRRSRSPQVKFHSHRKAHQTIAGNEYWYGDGPPDLGKSFTAKKAIKVSLRRVPPSGDRLRVRSFAH